MTPHWEIGRSPTQITKLSVVTMRSGGDVKRMTSRVLEDDHGGDKPWRERMDQLTELHPRRTSPTMQVGKENDHDDIDGIGDTIKNKKTGH